MTTSPGKREDVSYPTPVAQPPENKVDNTVTADGAAAAEKPADKRTAAGRMLSVMDAFDQDHLELSLSDIGRRAGLTLSTAHRLVGELRDWGALERTTEGRYTIGLRVLELGALEPQMLHLQDVAPRFLSDLQATVNTNVHLSIRDHHDVVYIEDLPQQQGAPVLSRLGGRWPLHATATGMVLLAFAPPQVRDDVLSGHLQRYTNATVTDPEVLRRMLAEVRQTGFSVLYDSITYGACAVGVPVRGPRNREIAALSVTLKKGGRQTPQNVLPVLAATARALSRALGAPSPSGPASSQEQQFRPYIA